MRAIKPLIAIAVLLTPQANAWADRNYTYPVAYNDYGQPMPPQAYPRYSVPAYQRAGYYPYAPRMAPEPTSVPAPVEKPAVEVSTAEIERTVEVVELQPSKREQSGDKKSRFFARIVPIVRAENSEISRERERMVALFERVESERSVASSDRDWLQRLAKRYRVKGNPLELESARSELVLKVDTIPVELALAQAANESAWGESRFAKEALNLFGVWTYDPTKGLVPKQRSEGKQHLVRKYESFDESIRHYLNLLNSHSAYAPLREIRAEHRAEGREPAGLVLAEGLERYSAKGKRYVEIIRSIISSNELERFRDSSLS